MSNGRQQTIVHGVTSTSIPVTSGVPQGSILGPLLFLLYENHLSNAVSNSRIATFADDTKTIFKTINFISYASALQYDLSNFEKSFSNVNLALNVSKCKVLRVTRKHNQIVYLHKLHDTLLESSDCERDLGILTSTDLSWSKHVDYQCAKASKTLGYVRRSTFDITDTAVRRSLYLTLVRTQLLYGSQIWAPQTINLIQRTERLQRRATKYILPFRCDTSYNQRLLLLDLLPLGYWHELLDMALFYKLTHGLMTIDPYLLPLPNNTNNKRATRSSDPDHLSFTTTRCKTSTYQKSYLNRCARIWNALPKELTGKNTSLAGFKYRIYQYYKLALETAYDVDGPRTWKSICLSCNMSRYLSCEISCCY